MYVKILPCYLSFVCKIGIIVEYLLFLKPATPKYQLLRMSTTSYHQLRQLTKHTDGRQQQPFKPICSCDTSREDKRRYARLLVPVSEIDCGRQN